MAGSPQLRELGELTPEILAMLDALVVQSHWNQVAQDWKVFHALGAICGVHDGHGGLVASGAVLPMDGVAWISMILVTPAARGKGLGKLVFEHSLRQVQAQGRIAMLDATPQGEPLYSQFGFEPLWRLTRWRREARTATAPALSPARPAVDTVAAQDARALGFGRRAFIEDLLQRPDSRCITQDRGFAIVRAGRVAHQVGPVVADTEADAIAMLGAVAASYGGPLVIDVPDDKLQLREALLAAGFAPQRGFARMALQAGGRSAPAGERKLLQAIAGPEFA